MKAYVYIYSRTLEKDYRPITTISCPGCPKEFLMRAQLRASGLLKASDIQLEQPQWLFMKEGNCAIWGVACMNKLLDSRYANDKTDTPIRGFTAFVIPDYNGEALPYDVACFSGPFCNVMDALFSSYSSSVSDIEVEFPIGNKCITAIGWNDTINTDIRYCKIMPCGVDGTSLLRSVMGSPEDISIAINVAKEDSVKNKEVCPPMNAVMRDGLSEKFVETGLMPPNKKNRNYEKITDKIHDDFPPGHISIDPAYHTYYKVWIKIKAWKKNILLIFSLVFVFVMVYRYVYKLKHENDDNKQQLVPTNSNIRERQIETENNIYNYPYGIPEQNRRVFEGTDEELHHSIPERDESRKSATPTDPVYDSKGNIGDAPIEQSSHSQDGTHQ